MRRRKLIPENPFDGVKAAATGIRDRQQFITRDEISRVLEACPDHHWRTIVTLARYGGLRTPSETFSLRWQDIDWNQNRIVVTSPKTEHHADKATRVIPLFPELRPVLIEAFESAPEGAVYVVDEKFRKTAMGPAGWLNANPRTMFLRIIRRAGLKPWPRLFHNLRASRETELVERFPLQAVTDWMGNTPKVALRHYLMTTDTHFDAAVRGDEKALQNALQQSHAMGGVESRPHDPIKKEAPVLQGLAGSCVLAQPPQVAGTGSEQTRFRSGKQGVASVCDAKCDAISANRIELLTRAVILVAGMNLAEAERAAVLARVIADLTSPTQRIPE